MDNGGCGTLRYSEIIGPAFYGILLSREKYALVDAHFLAAAHHRYRALEDDLHLSRMHHELYWRHLNALMRIVSQGDFTKAFDNTNRGLNRMEGWDPLKRLGSRTPIPLTTIDQLLPDPEMWLDMRPDERFGPGDNHPYDQLLRMSFQAQTHLVSMVLSGRIYAKSV